MTAGPVEQREFLDTIDHPIPEQTLRRIPLYHQILAEMQARGESYVSSRHLAQFFRIDDTQVRKDVSLIGYKGKPKAGYSILGLKKAIEEFLGRGIVAIEWAERFPSWQSPIRIYLRVAGDEIRTIVMEVEDVGRAEVWRHFGGQS